jgi:hypothetical protein
VTHCCCLRSAPVRWDVTARSVAARSCRSRTCCACSRLQRHPPTLGAHQWPGCKGCVREMRWTLGVHQRLDAGGLVTQSSWITGVRRGTRQEAWVLARRAMATAACAATSVAGTAAPATATTPAAQATPTRHRAARHVWQSSRLKHAWACWCVASAAADEGQTVEFGLPVTLTTNYESMCCVG